MRDIFADRTKLIDARGIRKVFALAAELKDPVDFSIGQPDFDVPHHFVFDLYRIAGIKKIIFGKKFVLDAIGPGV